MVQVREDQKDLLLASGEVPLRCVTETIFELGIEAYTHPAVRASIGRATIRWHWSGCEGRVGYALVRVVIVGSFLWWARLPLLVRDDRPLRLVRRTLP